MSTTTAREQHKKQFAQSHTNSTNESVTHNLKKAN